MKVLLINHFPLQGSGSGIYTMNIANELIKVNHCVLVIDIDNQSDSRQYSFERRTILCDRTRNANAELDFNFPCFTTHPRSTNTYYDLSDEQIRRYADKFTEVTRQAAARFQPDVIHAQHLWITPYAALQSHLPYVVTVHGTDLMGFRKDKRYHRYALSGAAGAKRIITISRQVHKDAIELYDLPEAKVRLNPNGFDSDIFRIKKIDKRSLFAQFGIKKSPAQLISFVGKFTDFKGIDILLKAAVKITGMFPDVAFALAGDGQLMPDMQELSCQLGLDNIYFLGHQTQEDVASLYNAADVSVVPSRIEPFGLVAIEALACGTPVVATRAGGLPDFINEKVGSLVKMDDPAALADAIIAELKNKTKESKGKYAAEYAVENYSWQKNLQNVIDLYHSALEDE